MSLSVTNRQIHETWNKDTIIKHGPAFLKKKKDKLFSFREIWQASNHNMQPKFGVDYKKYVIKAKKEFKSLKKASLAILKTDTDSLETKQLSKIALASRYAINYCQTILKHSNFSNEALPYLNQGVDITADWICLSTLMRGTAFLLDYTLPPTLLIAWKASCYAGIIFITVFKMCEFAKKQMINDEKKLFENALNPISDEESLNKKILSWV